MSFLELDHSCDSDPLKIEYTDQGSQESFKTRQDLQSTSAEVFVKEHSESSSSSAQSSGEDETHDELNIEPHDAVSVEFDDSTSAQESSLQEAQYTTGTTVNWPVLEIIPGGFISNNTQAIDEDFSTPITVKAPKNTIEIEPAGTPQIDIPKYLLMGHKKTYFKGDMKIYSCAKCDESFDMITQLTKHIKTHGQNSGKEEESKRKAIDEQFIVSVREHRCLWDSSSADYSDAAAKEEAWIDIVKKCSIKSVELAKCKWNNLRDTHRDIVKKQRNTSGASSRPWKYMRKMEFLLPYRYKRRKKIGFPRKTGPLGERLILCIREHPCLWDKLSKYYKNCQTKDEAWIDVATECDIANVQAAKTKWKSLRDIHREVLKKQQSGGAPKWRYTKLMQFLPPYRCNRKRDKRRFPEIEANKTEDTKKKQDEFS